MDVRKMTIEPNSIPIDESELLAFMPISDSNLPFDGTLSNPMIVAAEGKIYVVGGAVLAAPLSNAYAYDIAANEWQTIASFPIPSLLMSGVYLDGKIYSIGVDMAAGVLPNVYEYDIVADKWTRKADIPYSPGISNAGVAAVNGKIYVAGGRTMTPGNTSLRTLYEYNPSNDTWTRKADLLSDAICHRAHQMIYHNGELYFFGTRILVNNVASTVIRFQKYNISENKWYPVSPIPITTNVNAIAKIDDIIHLFCHESSFKYSYEDDRWEQMNVVSFSTENRQGIAVDSKIYITDIVHDDGTRDDRVHILDIYPTTEEDKTLSVYLHVGESAVLCVTNTPADNSSFTWTSSDDSVAIVDANGIVTGASEGMCKIAVTGPDGYVEYISVVVVPSPTEKNKRLAVYLSQGDNAVLCVTDNLADNLDYIWMSDDDSVATVETTGVITGVSKGICSITASDAGDFSQSISVRVG